MRILIEQRERLEMDKIKLLQEAADKGWADVAAGHYTDLADDQIEDFIGMIDPVNVPGTDTEHDNWQRKVTATLSDIFSRNDTNDILSAMDAARRGINPNA